MDEKVDLDHLKDLEEHALKILRVLGKIYENDSQFILTVLGTSFCTLGVGMYGTKRFKGLLDEMRRKVDDMFETDEIESDTEITRVDTDTIMTQADNDAKKK